MNIELFSDWNAILRIIIVGVSSYVLLIAMLRLTGKRTLSKMSAFDMIITIALGSTLSTVILDKNTALAEGMAALALLILLQVSISWLSTHSKRIRDLVHNEPTLLLHNGEFCQEAMQSARITKKEIQQALRNQGIATPEQARSVVLETNGKLSVVPR